MNKLEYDIVNILAILLISSGLFMEYGVNSALIGSGALILMLNLIMLLVSLRKSR